MNIYKLPHPRHSLASIVGSVALDSTTSTTDAGYILQLCVTACSNYCDHTEVEHFPLNQSLCDPLGTRTAPTGDIGNDIDRQCYCALRNAA